jgi:hypothetical protein
VEARKAADEYNDQLKEELGLASAPPPLPRKGGARVIPVAADHGAGLLLSGRF